MLGVGLALAARVQGSGLGIRLGVRGNVSVSIRRKVKVRRSLRSHGCRTPTHTYECRSHTTPLSTFKVQRRQCSVVLQTLRQLLGSLIADAVSCKPHARALSCMGELIYEYMSTDI